MLVQWNRILPWNSSAISEVQGFSFSCAHIFNILNFKFQFFLIMQFSLKHVRFEFAVICLLGNAIFSWCGQIWLGYHVLVVAFIKKSGIFFKDRQKVCTFACVGVGYKKALKSVIQCLLKTVIIICLSMLVELVYFNLRNVSDPCLVYVDWTIKMLLFCICFFCWSFCYV
jgi:hypothetical protein